jgi:cell division septation protein DedD
MTKDYAKKRPIKRKEKRMTPASIVLMLAIISVVVGFAFWVWHGVTHKVAEPVSASLPPVVTAVPVAKKAVPEKPKVQDVDYQFYTLLPKMKVENLNQGDGHVLPGVSTGFWLQMAVYYAEKDAESMIERLQLQGLMPQIAQRLSETSKKTLFAVVLGPYATKEEALKEQQSLRKEGLPSMIFHAQLDEHKETA